MRNNILAAIALSFATSSAAFAQSPTFNQALDGQMQRSDGVTPVVVQQSSRVVNPAPVPSSVIPTELSPNAGVVSAVGLEDSAIPALPMDIKNTGDIRYVSGGISNEELVELKEVENQFNVHVLFTAVGGGFVSDVTVRLIDASGNVVLTAPNVGPYFYAAVKLGTYTLEATQEGEVKKSTLKVGAKSRAKAQIRFSS